MRLYHGTSSRFLERILKRGLQPRGKRSHGNWKHTVPSSPDHVYLTNCYAMHYAASAQSGDSVEDTRKSERLLIVELDTLRLLPWNLHPDEDFLYQGMRENFPGPKKLTTMQERIVWFREHLDAFQGAWTDSIRNMGTCCHEGAITPAAITRYALVPRKHHLRFMSDPTVGITNHSIMGHFYRSLTAHVFGDSLAGIKPELPLQHLQLDSVERMSKIDRDGIEVHEVKQQERRAG